MAHYLMHTNMGRANIFSTDEVIAEAAQVLQDIDFTEYTKEEHVSDFVMRMNSAFCTGKLGSTKEPSEDEILLIVGSAFSLIQAHGKPTFKGIPVAIHKGIPVAKHKGVPAAKGGRTAK